MKDKELRVRLSADAYHRIKDAADRRTGGNVSELTRRLLSAFCDRHMTTDATTEYEVSQQYQN